MDTTTNGWNILDREAGVLSLEYSFAKQGHANTFVARMANGKLLVVSPAVRISDAALGDLAEFGEVGAVIAPNGFHHLGVAEWRAKFPKARFFAAPETVMRVRAKNPDAGDFEPLSLVPLMAGPRIGVGEVENTKCGETWVWVEVDGGCIWFVSDILANMPKLPRNPMAWLAFKLTGSAPGYRVFNLAMKFMVKDKPGMLRTLAAEMAAHPPTLVVPGHGAPLADEDIAAKTQALIAAALS
jgi:hypothetical protein